MKLVDGVYVSYVDNVDNWRWHVVRLYDPLKCIAVEMSLKAL